MIQLILICMGMCNVHRLMDDQYLDVPGVRVEEGVVAVPTQGPAHPVPWGVTCSFSIGVLEWTAPQAWRLSVNPTSSLGNWSQPWPLVSAWSAVDCSDTAAAALSSLDQLSAEWCALILMQPIKIGQQLTVSLDFKSTAGCIPTIWQKEGFMRFTPLCHQNIPAHALLDKTYLDHQDIWFRFYKHQFWYPVLYLVT